MGWDKVAEATQDAKAIVWDTCHKIYLAMDDDQVILFTQYGYDPVIMLDESYGPDDALAQLQDWFEDSCGLRFVSAVHTVDGDPNMGFVSLIEQFELEDYEDEDYEDYDEDEDEE
jgi:hypothetical protein